MTQLTFKFNNKTYKGNKGDTLAAALIRNKVHFVGRSFKTHRPRGILTADITEPNALVQLKHRNHSLPNRLATNTYIYEGLDATSINVWPNLKWDFAAINQLFSKVLVAGFYYKVFKWPKSFWKHVYEPLIRKMGGLGTCDTSLDTKTYDRMDTYCNLLIVGAGPAGIDALNTAIQQGLTDILIVDEHPTKLSHQITSHPEIRHLQNTTVFGYYDNNYLCALQHQDTHERTWHIHAKKVILATGAHERPLTFRNNDLPGIMLSSAVIRYSQEFNVACGSKAVLITNNDWGLDALPELEKQGTRIIQVVDLRKTPDITLHAKGKHHINQIIINGNAIECDLLVISGGFNPAVHLFSQSGGKLTYSDQKASFIPNTPAQNTQCIGACNGDVSDTLAVWDIPSGLIKDNGKHHIVDYAEDVSVADIQLAVREGMDSVELVKRYTTAGMGLDQGKISNVNAIGIQSNAMKISIPEVGTTKFRPPYTPVSFGALAGEELGDLLDPIRTTTLHDWHVNNGALFENVGQWKRPWYFPKSGETFQDALNRECLAVRTQAGLLDASTLGKIDIQGKDAGQFLDLLYTNMFSSLKVGKCRYGLMCHEDGMVFDDGVTARLSDNHYYMTTTTSGAANVLSWMEYWLQTEYPDLDVYLTSVTDHYGAIVISGPKSRTILENVFPDHQWDNESFPFMSIQKSQFNSRDIRLLRISFTGELSYEIHCPSSLTPQIWQALVEAGQTHGITPYGTETMHILRAEKGFIIVGQDTDGSVTPLDLGMGWAVSKKKDFLGKRSLDRSDMNREDRLQLVGLETDNPNIIIPEGAGLTASKASLPVPVEGHVTSSYYSKALGKSIALALVKSGQNRQGDTIFAYHDNQWIKTTIVSSIFYDPKGERQHV